MVYEGLFGFKDYLRARTTRCSGTTWYMRGGRCGAPPDYVHPVVTAMLEVAAALARSGR